MLPLLIAYFLFGLFVLAIVEAKNEYDRKEFGGWIDADRDCQDTRQEVLIRQSLIPVTYDVKGCKVVTGKWQCFFTGRVFTNPRQLDIDHFVPLKEAFLSGAKDWTREDKRKYANDLEHPYALIAVAAGANRSKGAKDPAQWMPPDPKSHCEYISRWIDIKESHGLNFDAEEVRFLMTTPCKGDQP